MKKQDLIKLINDDITASGAIPVKLPEKEISRIIDLETRYLYKFYRESFEPSYCIVKQMYFMTPEFKANRQIQLPACIVGIDQFKEIRGGGRIFGINDSDLTYNRALMSDMYMSPWSSDVVTYRTIQWSVWDLMRSFELHHIQFDFNENTHRITVKGRTPRTDVLIAAVSLIPESDFWKDPLVQRWLIAKCKIQMSRILGLFKSTAPGGVTVNAEMYKSEATEELNELKTYFKETNMPDFMTMLP